MPSSRGTAIGILDGPLELHSTTDRSRFASLELCLWFSPLPWSLLLSSRWIGPQEDWTTIMAVASGGRPAGAGRTAVDGWMDGVPVRLGRQVSNHVVDNLHVNDIRFVWELLARISVRALHQEVGFAVKLPDRAVSLPNETVHTFGGHRSHEIRSSLKLPSVKRE